MAAMCRDCLAIIDTAPAPARCPVCHHARVLSHSELFNLSVAHIDCDAFYASVEKHDDPSLRDVPLIVGGGKRGVVSTCCYIARISGVRSAMPMFQALKLCPDAVVVRPRIDRYVEVSRIIRAAMQELTPLIEPLSLDEAYIDLTGTERLHGAPPAVQLAGLLRCIETDLGITASVGLSHNKFLAKIASDIEKPRAFSVIGKAETPAFLAGKPVGIIRGVGLATQTALEAAGIRRIDDLLRWDRRDLAARFGAAGERLWYMAQGEDTRKVSPDNPVKSISNETTFHEDTGDHDLILAHLWRLSENVSDRAKARRKAGRTVVLKLRRADFRIVSRRVALREPTQIADRIWRAVRALFEGAGEPGPFRLVGVGLADIVPESEGDVTGDMLDSRGEARARAERVSDTIRARFGDGAIIKGRGFKV